MNGSSYVRPNLGAGLVPPPARAPQPRTGRSAPCSWRHALDADPGSHQAAIVWQAVSKIGWPIAKKAGARMRTISRKRPTNGWTEMSTTDFCAPPAVDATGSV